MFEFHKDKERYFDYQYRTSKEFVIPFLEDTLPGNLPELNVLEIGCAEAGVLKAFLEKDSTCVGIELSEGRTKTAESFLGEYITRGQLRLMAKNIYDVDAVSELQVKFDVIILKDVIEHIFDHDKFFERLKVFLKKDGIVFFAFPPWQMPFGGHQQMCKNKWASKLPYYHLLPKSIYRILLKAFGEQKSTIKELLEIKQTQISIGQFKKKTRKAGYTILKQQLFFTNPIYRYKFNVKVIKQNRIIGSIPYIRNFVSTCAYFVIKNK